MLCRKCFQRTQHRSRTTGIDHICFQCIFPDTVNDISLCSCASVLGSHIKSSICRKLFRQEKLTLKKLIACLIGFGGIIAVNLNGLDLSMNLLGDGFVIFSAISLAFSSVLIKIFSKHEDPVVISGYQFMAGGAVMVITGLLLGGRIDLSSPKGVLILLYLSCLSAVAYALWGILLKHNPVSRVTIFSFTTPVFGVLLTMLLLPENANVTPLNLILSLLLVALGVFLLNYAPRKKEEKDAE